MTTAQATQRMFRFRLFRCFLHVAPAIPASPKPNSTDVPGSGTGERDANKPSASPLIPSAK